jgi:hypothetical protein
VLPFPVMSEQEAKLNGYKALTTGYKIASPHKATREADSKMFWRIMKDMNWANCVLVEYSNGVEVWRHKSELDKIINEHRRQSRDHSKL